jgi:23S rRNA (guanosine2251-2'-O)-methyltransferase
MDYIALENIRSLYNVGSVMRSMSFFGLKNLLLVGYSGRKKPRVDKLHEKVIKTSLGAEKDIKVVFMKTSNELIKFCRKNEYKLVAVEQDEKSIAFESWHPNNDLVIVLGNEVNGVSQKILKEADEIVEIVRLGKKGSLNVATTAGVIIYKLVERPLG